MLQDGAHVFHGQAHAVGCHVGVFSDVSAAANGDVSVHVLHLCEEMLGENFVLGVFRAFHHLAGDTALMDFDEWQGSLGARFADEGDADGVGDIVEVDEDLFAFFKSGGIADQLAGEGVDAGVVHGC